jgi:hypothetical protein
MFELASNGLYTNPGLPGTGFAVGKEFRLSFGRAAIVAVVVCGAAATFRKTVDKLNAPIPKKPGLLQVTSAVDRSGFGVKVQLLPVSHLIVVPSQFTWKLCVPKLTDFSVTVVPPAVTPSVNWTFPAKGRLFRVPAHVPSNGFSGGVGAAADGRAGFLSAFSELSLLLLFDRLARFTFGLASSSADGLGFSSDSTIGAGSRCAATKIDNATSSMRRIRLAPAERVME